ncbi:MAG: hypothetical protein ACLQDL_10170 [Spirochaetia bacterium]
MGRHKNGLFLFARLVSLSVREAWRNRMGLIMFFTIPILFLGVVRMTAGEGFVPIKLYYPKATLQVMLTIRYACIVFGAAALCGFLSAYYALILFHQNFEYFRFCVFNGLRPSVFLAGRFAFLLILILLLAASTTFLTGALVTIYHRGMVFAGFVLIGIVYGACGGIAGTMIRDILPAFLLVALLADLDAAWLQNPAYYSSGQNLELIRWLPAFYPCQMIFAAGFTEEQNPAAVRGSIICAAVFLCILLVIITFRLRGVRRSHQTQDNQPSPGSSSGGTQP